ncbi:MAG: hypothetical protein FJ387_10300 [Verrucomicrobia bacterium]|nr:hypothetical protein [Verrucomicrobiota bacterium]
MRHFLTLLMVAGLIWGGLKFRQYAQRKMGEHKSAEAAESAPAPGRLPGLPARLEASLEAAKRDGADGLRAWLRQHRLELGEPRLTEIDLDYVVLVGGADRAEARRVLDLVQKRIRPDSPVYKRFQQLDRAYPRP